MSVERDPEDDLPDSAPDENSEPVEARHRQGDEPIGAQVWQGHIEHPVGEDDDADGDGSTGAARMRCGIRDLTAQNFARSLRRGGRHTEAAYAELVRRLKRAKMARHPFFHGLSGDDLDARVDEAAQAYCEHLLRNPAKLAAATVKSWGLVEEDLRRFLNRLVDRSERLDDVEPRWRRHLARKIKRVLSQRGDFAPFGGKRWGLTEWAERLPGPGATAPQELVAALPPLPADYRPQRPDQLPPIAHAAPLTRHLRRVLEICQRPRLLSELVDLCWSSLQPPPAPPRRGALPEGALERPHGHITPGPSRVDLDELIGLFLSALDGDTRRVAALYYRGGPGSLSVREVADTIGKSHGTVSNRIAGFRAALEAFLQRHELDHAEAEVLLEGALDRLNDEASLSRHQDPAIDERGCATAEVP